jgi:hypothetical protein
MGGGLIRGEPFICDGEDVLAQLKRVFENPNSRAYRQARANNHFGSVPNAPGNYNDLIDAYRKAGLVVPQGWVNYLTVLGTVNTPTPQQGPQNIYDIAQFRCKGLTQNKGMSTMIHDGGHVHTRPGSGIDPDVIDSPCPKVG